VELAAGIEASGDEAVVIADRLGRTAQQDLRVTATITLVEHGTLPRTEGKTRRVVRR